MSWPKLTPDLSHVQGTAFFYERYSEFGWVGWSVMAAFSLVCALIVLYRVIKDPYRDTHIVCTARGVVLPDICLEVSRWARLKRIFRLSIPHLELSYGSIEEAQLSWIERTIRRGRTKITYSIRALLLLDREGRRYKITAPDFENMEQFVAFLGCLEAHGVVIIKELEPLF